MKEYACEHHFNQGISSGASAAPFALPFVDDRADNRLRIGRVAARQGLHLLHELGDKLVVLVLVDDEPVDRHADLPLVDELAEHRPARRRQ